MRLSFPQPVTWNVKRVGALCVKSIHPNIAKQSPRQYWVSAASTLMVEEAGKSTLCVFSPFESVPVPPLRCSRSREDTCSLNNSFAKERKNKSAAHVCHHILSDMI